MRKVQSVQTNTLKGITGQYGWSLRELLKEKNWMSVFQLPIYQLVLLYWKVMKNNKPERLVRRYDISINTEAQISLTERVWSRKVEYHYRQVEQHCIEVVRLSQFKKTLSVWIKSNISIHED